MNLGFFCNEFPPRPHGGIGTFVQEVSRALVRGGHAVTVVEFGDGTGVRHFDGVRIVTLPELSVRRVAWLANRLKLLLWLKAAARRGEIDIFEIPDFQGWLPFPFEQCPVVVRLHHAQAHIEQVMGDGAKGGVTYWLERQTLRYHPRWIGVSRYILDAERAFFKCTPKAETVIYCPLPRTDGVRPPSRLPDGRLVLFVGSVSERKGALVLAEAMAPLLEEDPQLSLVYVGAETHYGGRPISEEIRRRVGTRVASRVVFTGFLPHPQVLAYMAAAAVFAFPSRVESFSMVVMEAMSVGTPVVFSKDGPGPELIEDGVSGLLIDPRDVHAVRQAIRRFLSDSSYARALAERGRASVESRFTLDRCVTETLAFYERVLR